MSTTKAIILSKRLPSKSQINSSNNTSAVHGPPDGRVKSPKLQARERGMHKNEDERKTKEIFSTKQSLLMHRANHDSHNLQIRKI